ncbi:MAG: hypothetical protein EOM20_06695 [Spartobacteria bacterium]|nr:hypothetical protein [Spartobacteria bacterium]
MKKTRTLFMIGVLALLAGASSFGWSGREHYWINLAATIHLEDDMPGINAYGRKLAEMGHLPDLWKGIDPTEGNRHYMDIEDYGYPDPRIDRAHAGLLDPATGRYSPDAGIIPWVILDTLEQLTEAMKTTNWSDAAEIAAAMGHYVGDLHMPLHTTANFNGDLSDNLGVHKRWESEMPRAVRHSRYIEKKPFEYLEDPWSALTNWIIDAHQYIPAIMDADTLATEYAGGDQSSQEYYDLLWEETSPIFAGQRNLAAQHLASLWYTAWINAGRPAIPPLPGDISDDSIFIIEEPDATDYTSWIVLGVFILLALAVIWKSMTARPVASQ